MIHTPKFSKFKKFFRAKPIKRVYKNINYPALFNGSIGLQIISPSLLLFFWKDFREPLGSLKTLVKLDFF